MDNQRIEDFIKSKYFWIPSLIIIGGYILVEISLFYSLVSSENLARISAAMGILGGLLSWIFANTQYGAKAREEVDKKNFENFLKMFPVNGTAYLFETHWFEKPFPTSIFSNFDQLENFYNLPGKKFLNLSLQKEFNLLMENLDATFSKLSGYTSYIDDGMSGFPVELQMRDRTLYESRAREINELTKKSNKQYREFVNKWCSFFLIPH